jgi:hypothetical protein
MNGPSFLSILQGPESGTAEVVCQSDTGGVITSGGGFSTLATLPSWQSAAVSSYLSTVSPQPAAGYYLLYLLTLTLSLHHHHSPQVQCEWQRVPRCVLARLQLQSDD